ncbi:MAG: efflux RND transporter periplasmic adaptor subunit [Bacteroidales bacterium]|nr:efflux RND transporter periplasmic adaptor subunit [Bacteroidales bacterium]
METKSSVKKSNKNLLLAFIVLIAVIGAVIIVGIVTLEPKDELIQGQAEANETRISGKLTGRIANFYVTEGVNVKKGDTLVSIFSAEAEAKLMQVEALKMAAMAQNQKADAGTRPQIIQSAYEMWMKAQAGVEIAKKSYDRVEALFEKGVVTAQKRDEAQANYKAMVATEKAAKSQYDLALAGAQKEDKEMTAAAVSQATAGVDQVEAILADSHLTAPIDGQVSIIYPLYGELVGAGAPIMSLLNNKEMWVSFNVRENLLNSMKINDELNLIIPALDNKEVKMKVYMIRDLGTYAIWRATKTTGQYDAKTFEVRCRPAEPIDGFRPGMTVLWKRKI